MVAGGAGDPLALHMWKRAWILGTSPRMTAEYVVAAGKLLKQGHLPPLDVILGLVPRI
jgi:hypothetical protein